MLSPKEGFPVLLPVFWLNSKSLFFTLSLNVFLSCQLVQGNIFTKISNSKVQGPFLLLKTNFSQLLAHLYLRDYFVSYGASLVAQTVKNLPVMKETWVRSLGQEYLLQKGMATHSSILAWRIPWTEEPGGLQSMGSQRVRLSNFHFHSSHFCSLHTFIPMTISKKNFECDKLSKWRIFVYVDQAFWGQHKQAYFINWLWKRLRSSLLYFSSLLVPRVQWCQGNEPRLSKETSWNLYLVKKKPQYTMVPLLT